MLDKRATLSEVEQNWSAADVIRYVVAVELDEQAREYREAIEANKPPPEI